VVVAHAIGFIAALNGTVADVMNVPIDVKDVFTSLQAAQMAPAPEFYFNSVYPTNPPTIEKTIPTEEGPPSDTHGVAPDPGVGDENIGARLALNRLQDRLDGEGFEDAAFDDTLRAYMNYLDGKPEFDDINRLEEVKKFLDRELKSAVEEESRARQERESDAAIKRSLDEDLADAVEEQAEARALRDSVAAGVEIEVDEVEIVAEFEGPVLADRGVVALEIGEIDDVVVGSVEEWVFAGSEELGVSTETIDEADVDSAGSPANELIPPPAGSLTPPAEASGPGGAPAPGSGVPPAPAPPPVAPPEPEPR
jgi:hypothetical protein